MRASEILQELQKYGIEFDYSNIIKTIDSLVREYNFSKEIYYRTTLDKDINLVPRVWSLPGTFNYKDLYLADYFIYNLEHCEHYKEELESFYTVLLFLNEHFFIDDSFDLEKVKLLKQLIEDESIKKITKYILGKEPKELIRESSFYYKDEVYKFAYENNLLTN